jgi:elongation factor Ts
MEVRKRTLAPIWGCKKALEGCDWDVDLACMSIAKALHDDRHGTQIGSQGMVGLYSHAFGKVGVVVEISCESSYVAKSRDFVRLVNTISAHIAWSNPQTIDGGGDMGAVGAVCLLDQVEMKDTQGKKTIREIVEELSKRTGEDIRIIGFSRFEIGKSPVHCLANLPMPIMQ